MSRVKILALLLALCALGLRFGLVSGEAHAANPLTMFQDQVDITGVTISAWYDIDLDSHVTVPTGAVDAIVRLDNDGGGYTNSVRANGSSDTITGILSSSGHITAVVKLDGGNIIEYYASNANATIWIVGFTMEDSSSFLNRSRFDTDITKNGTWQDVDASAHGVPSGADGVWVEINALGGEGGPRSAGIRTKGSTDTFMYGNVGDYFVHVYQFAKLDASRKFQAALDVLTGSAWIVGYTKGLDNVYDDQVDYDQTNSWSWQATTITEMPTSEDSYGVIFHQTHPSDNLTTGIRHADSSDTHRGNSSGGTGGAGILMVIGANTSRQVDIYNSDADGKHMLAGYAIPLAEEEAVEVSGYSY